RAAGAGAGAGQVGTGESGGEGGEVLQPPYNFGTTQVDAFLQVGVDYYIVPSLYKRNQPDVADFHLDGSMTVSDAHQPMVVGTATKTPLALNMSVGQYYDKKEQLRERVVAEAQRLGLSAQQLEVQFSDSREKMSLSGFKRRMMDMGFMLTDFPDDDLVVLDDDNDGTISPQEFIHFFKEGLKFAETATIAPPPDPPADDLLYKAVDLAGELSVRVSAARYLRQATTWFNCAEVAEGRDKGQGQGGQEGQDPNDGVSAKPDPMSRSYIKYDPVAAAKSHALAELDPKDSSDTRDSASDVGTRLGELEESSEDALSPLKSVKHATHGAHSPPYRALTRENVRSHEGGTGTHTVRGGDAHTAMTGMSVTRREAVQKAGAIAASKLHVDPHLQKAEVVRTKNLSALRSFKQNQLEAGKVVDSGVLRKKTKGFTRRRRDISKDPDAMELLSYWPSARTFTEDGVPVADVGVRQPAFRRLDSTPEHISANFSALKEGFTPINAADIPVNADVPSSPSSESKEGMPLLPLGSLGSPGSSGSTHLGDRQGGQGGGQWGGGGEKQGLFKVLHIDLWDYLVDCVITISISRPQNQATDRHRSLQAFKRRGITASSFAAFSAPRTPIPAPSRGRTPSKVQKGHITPRSARHTPGVASVVSVQSKSKQASAVLEAKDKLRLLEKERGKTYEEVYRRLVLLPVTSNAELEGDREAQGGTMASLSHAYLNNLFQKFDRNSNGVISKDEFQMAMGEMNVEVSVEDCDIFFNR
ncbi:hypothetical protein B484DRAFT_401911, partial [Ochromonadaceae sp. CCMP2298]